MKKFIKLTNNFEKHKGNSIYINVDHITSVFFEIMPDGMAHTFVYGIRTDTVWDVEESVSEVMKKIEENI